MTGDLALIEILQKIERLEHTLKDHQVRSQIVV